MTRSNYDSNESLYSGKCPFIIGTTNKESTRIEPTAVNLPSSVADLADRFMYAKNTRRKETHTHTSTFIIPLKRLRLSVKSILNFTLHYIANDNLWWVENLENDFLICRKSICVGFFCETENKAKSTFFIFRCSILVCFYSIYFIRCMFYGVDISTVRTTFSSTTICLPI